MVGMSSSYKVLPTTAPGVGGPSPSLHGRVPLAKRTNDVAVCMIERKNMWVC